MYDGGFYSLMGLVKERKSFFQKSTIELFNYQSVKRLSLCFTEDLFL